MTFAQSCRELMNRMHKNLMTKGNPDRLANQYHILRMIRKERLARAKDEVAFLKSRKMRDFILQANWESSHVTPNFIKKRIADLKKGIKILEGEGC